MLLKKLFFAWARYYEKDDTTPSTWAYIEASFPLLVTMLPVLFLIYHFLSLSIELIPAPDSHLTDSPSRNKLRSLPIALVTIFAFAPIFIGLFRSIKRNQDAYESIPDQTLKKYRFRHIVVTAIVLITCAVVIGLTI